MRKKVHVMLDLETLSLKQNAVITAIGAVVFDPFTGETDPYYFYTPVDIFYQLVIGRDVDPKTIEWWKSQQDALDKTLDNPVPIKTVTNALQAFIAWITSYTENFDDVYLWGNGKEFDNVIIRSLYNDLDSIFPIPFWNDLDVRTMTQLIDYDTVKERVGKFAGTKHDPVDDCNYQVKLVYEGLKLIKGLK